MIPAPAGSDSVPTFSVVALGPSGSGKSVFLTSMFHELNHPTDRRSYFLETSPADQIALSQTYRAVSDTARPWPPATRTADMKEYTF